MLSWFCLIIATFSQFSSVDLLVPLIDHIDSMLRVEILYIQKSCLFYLVDLTSLPGNSTFLFVTTLVFQIKCHFQATSGFRFFNKYFLDISVIFNFHDQFLLKTFSSFSILNLFNSHLNNFLFSLNKQYLSSFTTQNSIKNKSNEDQQQNTSSD